MDTLNDLWPLAVEAREALAAGYGPVMARTAAKDAGFPEGVYFGWILPALGLDPDPISARQLGAWSPFTALGLQEYRLATSEELGFLRYAGDGNYYLTDAGRDAAICITTAAYAYMAPLHPLPSAELHRLADLLRRLVDACLAAPEPAGKWHLVLSRRTDPGEMAPIVARIDQYLTDLIAYRNDAGLAVWQPYGISGAEWEAFTLVGEGKAATVADLYDQRAFRGHSLETYAEAVQDLIVRGWLAEDESGGCHPTAAGAALRGEAEAATEAYFRAPWACLDDKERAELAQLLAGLRDGMARG